MPLSKPQMTLADTDEYKIQFSFDGEAGRAWDPATHSIIPGVISRDAAGMQQQMA